ncbi:DOMON domain [Sesbania bispinosa]|nr:DOMON domain [Sesbania bispinosa]
MATGNLDIAFRHPKITSTNRWVAWAINPKNDIDRAMPGAQALVVVVPQKPILPPSLEQGNITYPITGLRATYQNNEVTIFATLTLPKSTKSLVHLWQDAPLSGSTPQAHDTEYDNTHSKETIIIA